MEYVKSRELKAILKPRRDALARDYQAMRAKNPSMARLLSKRVRMAADSLAASIWDSGTGSAKDGLAGLLE